MWHDDTNTFKQTDPRQSEAADDGDDDNDMQMPSRYANTATSRVKSIDSVVRFFITLSIAANHPRERFFAHCVTLMGLDLPANLNVSRAIHRVHAFRYTRRHGSLCWRGLVPRAGKEEEKEEEEKEEEVVEMIVLEAHKNV